MRVTESESDILKVEGQKNVHTLKNYTKCVHYYQRVFDFMIVNINRVYLGPNQKILGHSEPSITLDLYGHLYHEMQGEAVEIMDELVTPIKVNLRMDEDFNDKLHQSAPESAYLHDKQIQN